MRLAVTGWLCLLLGGVWLRAADAPTLYEQLVATKTPAQALALAQADAAAVPLLVQGLERKNRVAALCAWALAQHPQPATAPALRARLLQADQVAGYFSARALGRMPSPENVTALAALLPNEPNGFWELSSGGVGRLREAWDSQGRRYNEPAPTNMANLRVAYAAMESLGQIGGPDAARALFRGLTNDQYLIRYGAARGLGRMRHLDAEAKLARLVETDPVLMVRQGAKQALAVMRDEKLAASVDILLQLGWQTWSALTPALSPIRRRFALARCRRGRNTRRVQSRRARLELSRALPRIRKRRRQHSAPPNSQRTPKAPPSPRGRGSPSGKNSALSQPRELV